MTKLAYVQHLGEEGPGAIARWADLRRVDLSGVLAAEARWPAARDFDGFVVLGGPFSATADDPAWLSSERRWLRTVLEAERPVLGICLGAQLLALGLGAEVTRLERPESGFQRVELLDPAGSLEVLQWHEDTFTRPAGARRIAQNAACPEQGFRVGERIVGLQFHAEWTREIVDALRQRFGPAAPLSAPSPADAPAYAAMHGYLHDLLDRWREAF